MNTDELHVHLNGDEAMCFGSAFIASNSSSSFKVRKVFLTQHPQYAFKMTIKPIEPVETADVNVDTPDDCEGDDCVKPVSYEKEVILYKKTDYLGNKKTINLIYDRGMRIDVFALREVEGQDEPDEEPLVTYLLPELDEIAKKDVVVKEGSTKPKVSLMFELTRSHLFKLNGASVSVDETVIEEVVIEKKKDKKKKKEDKEETDDETDGETKESEEEESSEGSDEEKSEETEEDSEPEAESEEEEV